MGRREAWHLTRETQNSPIFGCVQKPQETQNSPIIGCVQKPQLSRILRYDPIIKYEHLEKIEELRQYFLLWAIVELIQTDEMKVKNICLGLPHTGNFYTPWAGSLFIKTFFQNFFFVIFVKYGFMYSQACLFFRLFFSSVVWQSLRET